MLTPRFLCAERDHFMPSDRAVRLRAAHDRAVTTISAIPVTSRATACPAMGNDQVVAMRVAGKRWGVGDVMGWSDALTEFRAQAADGAADGGAAGVFFVGELLLGFAVERSGEQPPLTVGELV